MPAQTLHDFVLDLLTNPDARSAFDLDPEGALREAGLTDITATDVQDVVPLVVDYAPVQGVTSLAPLGDQLGSVVPVTDPTDVIGQLQNVTQQVAVTTPATNVDVNAGVLGAISVDPAGLSAGAELPFGLTVGTGPAAVDADLSATYDVVNTLDADLVGGPAVDDLVDDVTNPVLPPSGGTLDPVTGPLGGVDGLLGGDPLGTIGGLGGQLGGGGLAPDVPGTVDSVTGQVGGVTDHVGGVVDGVTGTEITGGVSGGLGGNLGGVGGDLGGGVEINDGAPAGGGLLGLTDGLL
ncbi:hypothetical protein GA0074692_2397 [Micromonospora pallida]|uniref:Uncharacterized protein n=1 Tax=Micromonospora pallida TaxID=145854 RepID=A0A1C6SE05_9ACTN|nr:IniB N-terminal domain-containing protein [Micromonospora pallida]SCL27702.1 hypothetical protein GA0074692_2397 [Micromonospora pallida]